MRLHEPKLNQIGNGCNRIQLSRYRYGPAGVQLAVELLRIIEHLDGKGFFFAGELEIGWYSP